MPDLLRRKPRSIHGYVLERVCRLEEFKPGFLFHLLRASNLRRSAIFAVLSEIDFDCPGEMLSKLTALMPCGRRSEADPLVGIAVALLTLRPREMLLAVYGSAPVGFLGLLSRLGSQPLPEPSDYRLAFDLFSNPTHKARAKLLRQIPGLVSPAKIAAAARLEPVLLHPAVLQRMSDLDRVAALNAVLSIIRSVVPEATDDAIRQSLDGLKSSGPDMSEWVARWLQRMTKLPFTLPIHEDDPDLRVLHGVSMPELGRRLHNCAADRVGYIALGARAYVEWVGAGAPLVVELRALSEQRWVVEDIRGPHNAEPDPEVAGAVCDKLAACGVLTYRGAGSGPAAGKLRHLLGVWDIEHVEADSSLDALLNEAA